METLSKNLFATVNGSFSPTDLAAASTAPNALSANELAISASPFSSLMLNVSIKASRTSKSSREIELSAFTGWAMEMNINNTRNTALFLLSCN